MGTRERSWGRSKAAAAATAVAVLVAAALPGTSSAQQSGDVANGTAKAVAEIARIAPGVGSLDLAITSGTSIAQVTNDLAESQSQLLDLGLIGTALTAEGCSGEGVVSAEDLPQRLGVDNRGGDARSTRDEVPVAGSQLGAGRLAVAATTEPGSTASASGASIDLGGVLSLGAGTATAEATVLDGTGRQAEATVETTIDLAGLVQLRGLRWHALHRTGSERQVAGTFELGGVTLGGALTLPTGPLPLDQLEVVETTLNRILAPTGLSISFPRVEHLEEPADLVRVTPLRIVLRDSPVGGALLGPVLNLTREQREQLFDDLTAAVCEAADLLFVGDVGISVASGTGFLAIELGGVEAGSGEFEVGDAIGRQDAAGPVASVPEPASPPGTPADPVTPAPRSEVAAPEVDQARQVADVGPLERVCESVHPFAWPSCSEGAAPLVGLIGLLGTAAMVALDVRRQRVAGRAGAADATDAPAAGS